MPQFGIESVRAERLQDLTDHDATAEGVIGNDCQGRDQPRPTMLDLALWASINAKLGHRAEKSGNSSQARLFSPKGGNKNYDRA
jgi:hypothetical protein